MTVPFWCLLVGCMLPYFWLVFTAKARTAQPEGFDNRNPRIQATRMEGMASWAVGAQLNAFEALPLFGSAVVVNHLLGADPGLSAKLSLAWVACRVLHGVFYLTGMHVLRTLIFAAAMACAVALFVIGA